MLKRKEFYCAVQVDGTIPTGIRLAIAGWISQFPMREIVISIAEPKRQGSGKQRKYYFTVIVPVWMEILATANDEYYDKDAAHDHLMEEVGQWYKPLKKGQKKPVRRSYEDLDKQEREKHHTLCRMAAAKEGYDIPEPNEPPKTGV